MPAAFASLNPCDRLLSRIGTGDSLETCSSSFMVEMQVGGWRAERNLLRRVCRRQGVAS